MTDLMFVTFFFFYKIRLRKYKYQFFFGTGKTQFKLETILHHSMNDTGIINIHTPEPARPFLLYSSFLFLPHTGLSLMVYEESDL